MLEIKVLRMHTDHELLHRLKSGNPEISPGGVQNEKIENP